MYHTTSLGAWNVRNVFTDRSVESKVHTQQGIGFVTSNRILSVFKTSLEQGSFNAAIAAANVVDCESNDELAVESDIDWDEFGPSDAVD